MTNWTETSRLRPRPFTPGDAADLGALHGDPEVMRFIDDGRPVPREVIENSTLPGFLAEYRGLPHEHGCFVAEETATGRFLGWFSARPAVSAGLDGGVELGYRFFLEWPEYLEGAEHGDVEYALSREEWAV